MIPPIDLTSDRLDITATWRAVTGEYKDQAVAHLRGGTVTAVSVKSPGWKTAPVVMCRSGAAFIMSDEVMASIEARARGRRLQ